MKERTYMKEWKKYWYYMPVLLFCTGAALFFAYSGRKFHAAVQDNLDLFQAQYRMLQNTSTFWSRGTAAPFLGGVSRDVLPSERSLSGILYFLLDARTAYILLYILKVLVGTVSMTLLGKELTGADRHSGTKDSMVNAGIVLSGFAYGLIHFFPAFGIPFASIPLACYLMLRLYRTQDRRQWLRYSLLLLLYPFLSYFSYFGMFLLGYFGILFPVCLIMNRTRGKGRSGAARILWGIILLSCGYMFFEYRLFHQMLFSGTVTIRSSIVMASLTGRQAWEFMKEGFVSGMFHAEGLQKYLVLPVCMIYFLYRNGRNVFFKKPDQILREPANLCILLLLFNSFIYGAYYLEPFRNMVESILPPLKGWQFNRTVFFNPFVWYLFFMLVCVQIGRRTGKERFLAVLLPLAAAAIIIISPTRYNDLYHTLHGVVYEARKGVPEDALSYDEFYSEALFSRIKTEIGYREGDFRTAAPYRDHSEGEGTEAVLESSGADWSVAYGIHPAILEYNGIATLDGYLGFYEQSYKEAFRRVIAPALAQRPDTAVYYDDWGARCYLYSGTEDSIVQPVRNYLPGKTDSHEMMIDSAALKKMGCRYIFSRIPVSNEEDLKLHPLGIFEEEDSPYTIYVYEL